MVLIVDINSSLQKSLYCLCMSILSSYFQTTMASVLNIGMYNVRGERGRETKACAGSSHHYMHVTSNTHIAHTYVSYADVVNIV